MTNSILKSIFGFVQDATNGSPQYRQMRTDAIRDEWDNIIVDTCLTFDTGKWETGIHYASDEWVIVQIYKARQQAQKGHIKWVAKMKQNPKRKLKDVSEWKL